MLLFWLVRTLPTFGWSAEERAGIEPSSHISRSWNRHFADVAAIPVVQTILIVDKSVYTSLRFLLLPLDQQIDGKTINAAVEFPDVHWIKNRQILNVRVRNSIIPISGASIVPDSEFHSAPDVSCDSGRTEDHSDLYTICRIHVLINEYTLHTDYGHLLSQESIFCVFSGFSRGLRGSLLSSGLGLHLAQGLPERVFAVSNGPSRQASLNSSNARVKAQDKESPFFNSKALPFVGALLLAIGYFLIGKGWERVYFNMSWRDVHIGEFVIFVASALWLAAYASFFCSRASLMDSIAESIFFASNRKRWVTLSISN